MILIQSPIDDIIKRLSAQKGVEGVIALNINGSPIKSTLEPEKTDQYSDLITNLVTKTRNIVNLLDPHVLGINAG